MARCIAFKVVITGSPTKDLYLESITVSIQGFSGPGCNWAMGLNGKALSGGVGYDVDSRLVLYENESEAIRFTDSAAYGFSAKKIARISTVLDLKTEYNVVSYGVNALALPIQVIALTPPWWAAATAAAVPRKLVQPSLLRTV